MSPGLWRGGGGDKQTQLKMRPLNAPVSRRHRPLARHQPHQTVALYVAHNRGMRMRAMACHDEHDTTRTHFIHRSTPHAATARTPTHPATHPSHAHRTPQLNTLKQRHPWMTWVGSRRGRVSATYTQCKDMIIDCGRRLQRRSCVRWWRQARTRSPLAHPTLGWERACGEAHASQASTQPLAGIAAPRDEPSTACRARAASRPIPRHPVRRRAE